MFDILEDHFSEELDEFGIAAIPSIPELVYRLEQKYNDLKNVKGKENMVVYLSNTIDFEYYKEFIKSLKPDRDYEDTFLLLLLKDFIKLSRGMGTSIEDEIRRFYNFM